MSTLKTIRSSLFAVAAVAFALSGGGCVNAGNGAGSMKKEQSLDGTAWWVEDIDGGGVIDNSHTTIEFAAAGQVSGDTGCNRYFGPVEIGAGKISIGPLAGTRKACVTALMDQEMRFFLAMEKVSHWEIAGTGLLHLRDGAGETRLRAFRSDQ